MIFSPSGWVQESPTKGGSAGCKHGGATWQEGHFEQSRNDAEPWSAQRWCHSSTTTATSICRSCSSSSRFATTISGICCPRYVQVVGGGWHYKARIFILLQQFYFPKSNLKDSLPPVDIWLNGYCLISSLSFQVDMVSLLEQEIQESRVTDTRPILSPRWTQTAWGPSQHSSAVLEGFSTPWQALSCHKLSQHQPSFPHLQQIPPRRPPRPIIKLNLMHFNPPLPPHLKVQTWLLLPASLDWRWTPTKRTTWPTWLGLTGQA